MRYRLLIALAASLTLSLLVPSPSFAASSTTTGGSVSGGTVSATGSNSTSYSASTSTTGSPPASVTGGQTTSQSGSPAGSQPPPTACTTGYNTVNGVSYRINSCAGQAPRAKGNCILSSTVVSLFGVPLGIAEQMGTWMVVNGVGDNATGTYHKVTVSWCAGPTSSVWIGYSPPVPPAVTMAWHILNARLLASATPQRPTPWIMPSPAHPGPPPCSACTTYQESIEGYANHPEWLAVEQGPGVTSGLSMVRSAAFPGGTATVGVTLTPETVNFEWVGADSYPPFNAPVHTVSCPAGAIVTGAPAPLGYAPSSYSLARAYDTWQHALWYQWWYKHAIYGGPGCSGSDWAGGNGTPRRTGRHSIDYSPGAGGGHPRVEFYTPRQVTKQDCIDVGNTPQNPWPAWCYQVPTVDTIHAYLAYHITWTFGGVLAGATPPGLPTTYNVMTSDPNAVATTTLPVVAEHTHPTCFSGTGSRQQCNVNEQPGQGPMGPAPING